MTPEQVLEAVDTVMSRPFEWGPCDCCSAACDVYAALWGLDPMAPVRTQYTNLRGAASLIRESGGLPALAQRLADQAGLIEGDAVGGLALSTEGRSLLICITPGQWAGKTEGGFAILQTAWKGWHA